MGSLSESEISTQEDEITVLVTGFGPFKAQYPINPSWEIAKSLPPFLPTQIPVQPINTTFTTSNSTPASSTEQGPLASRIPNVRILVYPEPVRVSYERVRELVPKLWDGPDGNLEGEGLKGPKIDYMLHIGMAAGRNFYSVERRGHRDGYAIPDVDGKLCKDMKGSEGKKWVWEGCPEEIVTDVDIDDVWRRWRCELPDVDIRPSEDAGRYLCDFIYYSSLAQLWKRGEERRVAFLHVPVDSNEEAISRGKEVTTELIRALVVSGRMKRILKKKVA